MAYPLTDLFQFDFSLVNACVDLSILVRYANIASFVAVPCWVGPVLLDGAEAKVLLTVFRLFSNIRTVVVCSPPCFSSTNPGPS